MQKRELVPDMFTWHGRVINGLLLHKFPDSLADSCYDFGRIIEIPGALKYLETSKIKFVEQWAGP